VGRAVALIVFEGGKSKLRRAVSPEQSGNPVVITAGDGKCHRKDTASTLWVGVRVKRWGKSPPPR